MIRFEDIQQGDSLPEIHIQMDRKVYFQYNRLVGEINPLHFDRGYAQSLGYRDIVVAGVYTFSFIPQMIEKWAGEAGRIVNAHITYRNPVYIDETIVQKATIKKSYSENRKNYVQCEVIASDLNGKRLTHALVLVQFP